MDPQFLIQIAQLLLALIFVMVGVNLYLVMRLKDIDPFAKWNPNVINPALFMIFCVGGLIVAGVASGYYYDKMILTHDSASAHGMEIDRMFWNTMIVTIIVVVVTNFLLFFYAWKYRTKSERKALYYPHNNRLELIWTVVPAIVLTVLVIDGVITWNNVTSEAPESVEIDGRTVNTIDLEVNGEQFAWTIRYPGADMEFGETSVQYMEPGNGLGFNFEDRRGHDDIVSTGIDTIHLPVGIPVRLTIKSRDVLHSATLAHFRVKMDAVPGMATSFWFTPIKTTEDMRKKMGDDFNYEMSCQQICGGGHWNMRRVFLVESHEKYRAWINKKKPFYLTWKETNNIGDDLADKAETEVSGVQVAVNE